MGWKGTVRSIQAASREAERNAARQQRELAKQQKQAEKMEAAQRAAYEVAVFENQVELLQSVHRENPRPVDWQAMLDVPAPVPPAPTGEATAAAEQALAGYSPGRMDKMFGRVESKQAALAAAVEEARAADQQGYVAAVAQHERDHADWESFRALAAQVLERSKDGYVTAFGELQPFAEISELGSSVSISTTGGDEVAATVRVHRIDIVPSERKTQLQSGKLSTKQMPKGELFAIYQDYVCGAVLRVANELLAFLPTDMVFVTAVDDLLNTATGHKEEQPIVSAAIPRATLASLNVVNIDPSDAMANFVHNMTFKKTKGFDPVERVTSGQLSD